MGRRPRTRRWRNVLLSCGVIGAAFGGLALPVIGVAGGWHTGASLICSDCHTMHNSWKGGQVMRYDASAEAAPHLLRAGTPQLLCEQCHAGGPAGTTAPAVIGPLAPAYAAVDPAGGFFTRPADETTLTGLGHTMGVVPLTVPLSTRDPAALTCASCHDTHGNDRFRNLLPNPSGSGTPPAVSPTVDAVVSPNGFNPAQAYASANLTYRRGMSEFCLDCHNDYANGMAHPSDLRLRDYAAVFTVWSTPPVDAAGSPLPRLRVQHPDAIEPVPPSPSDGDSVFCLSCHRAHGSPNPMGLIYPDPATSDSLCNQCHAQ